MKTNQQDLILKMLDGSEAGQLVPIQIEQCLLGSDPQCAIVRTPDGVQVQCTKGLMLINDVETKVKWLAEGDTVTLGDSTFEIAELGHTASVEFNDNAVEASPPSSADAPSSDAPSSDVSSSDVSSSDVSSSDVSSSDASSSVNGRIEEFESLLNEQQQQHLVQNEALEERLSHITMQLESLCDHLLDFEDRIEEQKLLTQQAIEKQQLLEYQVAAQPVVSPVTNGLAAISAPANEPTAEEVTATEPVITQQVDASPQVDEPTQQKSDTVILGHENQQNTEQFTDLATANKTEESFLPIEESVPESVKETENSLLESLGLTAHETADSDAAQPETSESAIAASELDSVFGTASQQPASNLESTQSLEQETQPTEEVSTEIDATDTSELDSLLNSLQNDTQDEGNKPAIDADGGLGALEDRIAEAQASLSNEIAEDSSPATELNSLFDSLGTESSETTEPSPSQEPAEEKPANESVTDLLARMNPDGNTSWDEENSNESSSVTEPVMETETATFAATDESVTSEGAEGGAEGGVEGEGNVDDYMSALLQRLKSGPDANNAPPASKKTAVAAVEAAPATPVEPAKPEPVKMPKLKPEEFVPKSVAKVQTNKLAEMRALANQSATNSVTNSNIRRNKEKNLGLQIGSLIGMFAGIILFLVSHHVFDLFFILAVASTAIGAACLYLLYGTKKPKTAAAAHAVVSKAPQNEQSEKA